MTSQTDFKGLRDALQALSTSGIQQEGEGR